MNVTFLVSINLDDLSGLPDTAREIQQDLENAGFEVKSVLPWKRPSLGLGDTGNIFQPEQQPTTQQNIL